MARLWRSVVMLGICLIAVIGLRIYLNKKVDVARTNETPIIIE